MCVCVLIRVSARSVLDCFSVLILFFCAFSHQVCGSVQLKVTRRRSPQPRASISLFRDGRAGRGVLRLSQSHRSEQALHRLPRTERDRCMLGLRARVRRSNTRLLARCFRFPSAFEDMTENEDSYQLWHVWFISERWKTSRQAFVSFIHSF